MIPVELERVPRFKRQGNEHLGRLSGKMLKVLVQLIFS